MREIGTNNQASDYGQDVTVDSSGNVYVTGRTGDDLAGTHEGGQEIFLTKYDSDGDQKWIDQIGTSEIDAGGALPWIAQAMRM